MKTVAGNGLVLLVAAGCALSARAAEDAKLRVLLLSGQNNHGWQATTPVMVKLLKDSGRFDVTVTDEPAKLTGEAFGTCDVIVSNWTPWPDVQKRVWPAATEKAFLDFLRGGGGLLVVHAACTAMQTWPEFQQAACATWALGQTGHGKRHEFAVRIADADHPVTAGMGEFRIFDELWHRMGAQPNAKALCTAFSAKQNGGSGQDEAVVFWTEFGKGRGLNLVLGHDERAMSCPAWGALLLRGTEWAATGKVTIPLPAAAKAVDIREVLKAACGYKFGDGREVLVKASEAVNAAATDPARRKEAAAALVESLAGQATVEYRKFACEQLSLVGSDAEVPALAGLLGDKDLSLSARSALERMPGEAALAAMRAALPKATGATRVGLICSLGERRGAQAVDALAAALTAGEPVAAGAAVDALGKIGGQAAVEALLGAKAKLPAEVLPLLADALLRCADGLRASGDRAAAAALYEPLSGPDQPKHVRVAAFPGLVACRQEKAAELMLAALRGQDAAMQRAGVRAVRAAGDDAALMKAVAAELPKLPPPVRAMLIETLAERRVTAALPAVAAEAGGDDPTARRAAIAALGRLGDATTVPLLAKLAAGESGGERQLARLSLVRLRGEKVDAALIAAMKPAAPAVRCELIAALAERKAAAAVPALLGTARDDDGPVRAEAIKALGMLADLSACEEMVGLLGKASSDADRSGLEQALVAVCRRGGANEGVERVLAARKQADAALAGSLLRVLARLGGPKALAEVRKAVGSSQAELRAGGIRALAEWETAEPLEDLLSVAQTAGDDISRVLALRGFVRLSARAADRKPEAMAALYARALKAARRAEEKKALLGGLGAVRCDEALATAEGLLAEPELAKEAALAVVRIADGLWVSKPQAVRAALKRLLASPAGAGVRVEASRVLLELSRPVNLARDGKAASPDGWEKDGASGGDQAAIDGDPQTYWDEADGKDLYRLVVTFPEPRKVAAVRITGYQQHNYAPKDFEVLCDGKPVQGVRDAQYKDNRLTVAFPETRCTSVELKITGYYGRSPAVREMEVFGLPEEGVKGEKGPALPPGPKYAWLRDESSVSLRNGEQVVWKFVHKTAPNEKPYFHPLALPDGAPLTWLSPPDHKWHLGMWFSWKYLDGVNYWEPDARTGLPAGETRVTDVRVTPGRDFSARIEMTLSYRPRGKDRETLAEKRLIAVGAPDAAGRYRIDWTSTFTAGAADVVLKGGESGGGYAGLSIRLAKATRDWKVIDSAGRQDAEAHGKKARWVAWSGEVAPGGAAGIALFDHPGNVRHPSPWYVAVRRDIPFHYFSPALLYSEPLALPAGKGMTLKYRTLIHPGPADVQAMEAEWKAFSKASGAMVPASPKRAGLGGDER